MAQGRGATHPTEAAAVKWLSREAGDDFRTHQCLCHCFSVVCFLQSVVMPLQGLLCSPWAFPGTGSPELSGKFSFC